MKYIKPELEKIELEVKDIITASADKDENAGDGELSGGITLNEMSMFE